MGRHSLVRAFAGALLVVASMIAAPPAAFASGARLRWLPSTDSRVEGYKLYVRGVRAPYGGAVDLGRPSAAADGALTAVVQGLAPNSTYHLALSAYTADGTESALSAELGLGAPNPCVVDFCIGRTSCEFGVVPDGTWCTHDGDTDPCTAIGTCSAGKCAAAAGVGELTSARARVTVRQRRGWLTVRGTFAGGVGFDPRTTGASVEIGDPNGSLLYRASIPGDVFDGTRDLRAFRYLGTRREARLYNGLRVVELLASDGKVTVTARAESVELRAALAQPGLHVTLRFGDTCARDLTLTCRRVVTGGISCR